MKKQLLLFALMLLPMVASAEEVQIDSLWYNLDTKTKRAEVIQNKSAGYYSGDFDIPDVIIYQDVEYSVTSIGEGAFQHCYSLTSVTIPESVTSIGEKAFYGCTGLTSITIPNSVTSIGDQAFYLCYSLTSITIPNSVTSIRYGAFYGCSSLTSITIPESVTSIGNYAFYNCYSLTSVTIPNSVTSIRYGAFAECSSLTSITIGKSVQNLASDIFGDGGRSGLTSITVVSGNTKYDSRNNCNAIIETNTNTLIAGCIKTVIPNSVTCIGDSAFKGCPLTSITIPNSVTRIGESAFSDCYDLTSVVIPESVTSIGRRAFFGCGLPSIAIPNSVTSIGKQAFWGSNLTSVVIPESVTIIEECTFQYCSNLTSVVIPNSVTSIGEEAFYGCSSLTSVTIPNSVTSIGDYAFASCRTIEDVYCFAEAVPSTNASAFKDSNIQSVTLHVPEGSVSDYESSAPWSQFGTIVGIEKCATPTIAYANGKVRCTCETEGVTYIYTITPSISTGQSTDGVIPLSTSFTVSVKATCEGYEDSEIATTTVNLSQVGDMDGDGELSVTDITSLVNAILGK